MKRFLLCWFAVWLASGFWPQFSVCLQFDDGIGDGFLLMFVPRSFFELYREEDAVGFIILHTLFSLVVAAMLYGLIRLALRFFEKNQIRTLPY